MKWLNGKKSYIGSIAAGLLGVVFAADAMLHDDPLTAGVTELNWLTWQVYAMVGSAIAAWTGVAWRHSASKQGAAK